MVKALRGLACTFFLHICYQYFKVQYLSNIISTYKESKFGKDNRFGDGIEACVEIFGIAIIRPIDLTYSIINF